MNFFSRIKVALFRFMQGRYGTDELNRFLTYVWFATVLISWFSPSLIVLSLELVLCILVLFRGFSRNLMKRRRENAIFQAKSLPLRQAFRRLRVRIRDRKIAHFFKCPYCKAPIRMPRKIGTFHVRCQKCHQEFDKTFRK